MQDEMKNNLSSEVPKVVGSINISHDVVCPHCNETMYDDWDRDWWNQNVTDQLPNQEEYKSQFKVNCMECGKPFIIDGFVY
jgi:DNA-directed RNA polymerase subunit RPC12/RpoP